MGRVEHVIGEWPAEDIETVPRYPICGAGQRRLLYDGLSNRIYSCSLDLRVRAMLVDLWVVIFQRHREDIVLTAKEPIAVGGVTLNDVAGSLRGRYSSAD